MPPFQVLENYFSTSFTAIPFHFLIGNFLISYLFSNNFPIFPFWVHFSDLCDGRQIEIGML